MLKKPKAVKMPQPFADQHVSEDDDARRRALLMKRELDNAEGFSWNTPQQGLIARWRAQPLYKTLFGFGPQIAQSVEARPMGCCSMKVSCGPCSLRMSGCGNIGGILTHSSVGHVPIPTGGGGNTFVTQTFNYPAISPTSISTQQKLQTAAMPQW